MKTASWVIINKQTGQAFLETYSEKVAMSFNKEKFEAVPILEYLQNLNRKIKENDTATVR